MKLIECVPNFSEGRDIDVVHRIRDRIAAVYGVSILHVTADASHNRSVITFVAPYENMVDAAFAAIRAARDHIDIRAHAGVHPRIGAADVVPFIPLDGATMDDCVAIARALGARVGAELEIPVYLYEHAASTPARRNLADVRRGGLDRLRADIVNDASRAPDFGPARVHPSFGAVAIGARSFLVAFNVHIGDAAHVATARDIAREIRESGGGLPALKALGLEVGGEAQVSMNLVDIERTSLADAFDAVENAARVRGLDVTWSEIIGLVPERVAFGLAERRIRLRDSLADHVLERQLLAARTSGVSLGDYIGSVGSGDPFPGGGSVAAITGALASALVRMVASLTLGRERFANVAAEMHSIADTAGTDARALEELARADSEAYARVTDARRLPHATSAEAERRQIAVEAALLRATEVPLEVARIAARVATRAVDVAKRGNGNAITDAGVAALMAAAGCRAAAYNVRVNVNDMRDAVAAARFRDEALDLVAAADRDARTTSELVERALAPG